MFKAKTVSDQMSHLRSTMFKEVDWRTVSLGAIEKPELPEMRHKRATEKSDRGIMVKIFVLK